MDELKPEEIKYLFEQQSEQIQKLYKDVVLIKSEIELLNKLVAALRDEKNI